MNKKMSFMEWVWEFWYKRIHLKQVSSVAE